MGCDIHLYAERHDGSRWVHVDDDGRLDARSYGVFAFLAGVRNYSGITPIREPRGFPPDPSSEVQSEYDEWDCNAHTPSWLTMDELLSFNYDATMEDRRCTAMRGGILDGGCTCAPGQGKAMTYREFLGQWFFEDLAKLRAAGAERIVFWFDN